MTVLPATELEELWTELAEAGDPGQPGRRQRRVLTDSRHDCFLAVDFPQRRRLLSVVGRDMVVSDVDRHEQLTTGVLLERTVDGTGLPTVSLVLLDGTRSDIFTALTQDLLRTLSETNQDDVGETFTARLREWQRMLSALAPEGLSPERQRGLLGELLVMRDLLLPAVGTQAVPAWTGPDLQLQDFQFPTVAVEVKTSAGRNLWNVQITGERQLDETPTGTLLLVTLALDVRRGGSGESLPEVVDTLRDQVDNTVRDELELRLTRAGYLGTQAHLYQDRRYVLRRRLVHRIREGFPRIAERDLPPGVSNVSYAVDLLTASEFTVTEAELTSILGAAT